MGRKSIGDIITELTIALLIFIAVTFITKWLWNGCLIPAVDGIHEITFWQAFGLQFLFSVLFKTNNYTKEKIKEWMK